MCIFIANLLSIFFFFNISITKYNSFNEFDLSLNPFRSYSIKNNNSRNESHIFFTVIKNMSLQRTKKKVLNTLTMMMLCAYLLTILNVFIKERL